MNATAARTRTRRQMLRAVDSHTCGQPTRVIVSGELEGNIDAASRVELLQSGVLNGDLKAGSLTVAAGSRMRGRAEFGWDEKSW